MCRFKQQSSRSSVSIAARRTGSTVCNGATWFLQRGASSCAVSQTSNGNCLHWSTGPEWHSSRSKSFITLNAKDSQSSIQRRFLLPANMWDAMFPSSVVDPTNSDREAKELRELSPLGCKWCVWLLANKWLGHSTCIPGRLQRWQLRTLSPL